MDAWFDDVMLDLGSDRSTILVRRRLIGARALVRPRLAGAGDAPPSGRRAAGSRATSVRRLERVAIRDSERRLRCECAAGRHAQINDGLGATGGARR
jgi:hypothetical protein